MGNRNGVAAKGAGGGHQVGEMAIDEEDAIIRAAVEDIPVHFHAVGITLDDDLAFEFGDCRGEIARRQIGEAAIFRREALRELQVLGSAIVNRTGSRPAFGFWQARSQSEREDRGDEDD